MEKVAKKLNIKQPSDWGTVNRKQIKETIGLTLLRQYNFSLLSCLRSVYKGTCSPNKESPSFLEIDWKTEWFKVPNSYWTSKQNMRQYMDSIALKLHVRSPKEWGQISNRLFKESGGGSLLLYHKNSLFFCLQSAYEGSKSKV